MHRIPATARLAARAALVLCVCAVAGCAGQLFASHRPAGTSPTKEATCMRTSPALAEAVSWNRTGVPGEVPVLDAWCAAVGPALLAAPEQPEAMAGVSDTLVVVSWNVHVGGGDLVRFVEDLRSGALTGGAPVNSFVLLLQEAYRSGSDVPSGAEEGAFPVRIQITPPSGERLDVVAAARRLALFALYAPSMRNGGLEGEGAEDRGNAILSTMPLTAPEAIELPYEVQRRVAVAGTVSGTGSAGTPWRLRMVSAHLDTRSPIRRFWDSFGGGRARQARALADAVTDANAVLGADLNSWSAAFLETAVPTLRARFPGSPSGPSNTFTAGGIVPRTLDHLMLRLPEGSEARLRRAENRYGSDHYPVIGFVKLPS